MQDRLKKISDLVFEEITSCDHRPLEWRRDFRHVTLRMKDASVQKNYSICEREYPPTSKGEGPIDPDTFPEVVAHPSRNAQLTGEAELLDPYAIYVLDYDRFNEPEDGLYTVSRPKLPTKITLTGVETPREKLPRLPNCNYPGISIWSKDSECHDDRIEIYCDIPNDYLVEIIETIKADPSLELKIGIDLLVYSNEMDDALRENWHHQDLIVAPFTPAPLNVISLNRRKTEDVTEVADSEVEPPAPPPAYVPLIVSIEQRLSKFTTPLWIIAVLMFLYLFK